MLQRKQKILYVFAFALILAFVLSINKIIRNQSQSSYSENQKNKNLSRYDQLENDYLNEAPIGLQNLSNTCYMSSVLQILFKILPEFMRKNEGNVLKSFFRLKDERSPQVYRIFKRQLQKEIELVNGWQQQDAHEFLIKFLEALKRQNSVSQNILSQLFSGRYIHKLKCPQGHHKFNHQDFDFISLSFPQQSSENIIKINQLINQNMQAEKIQGLFCLQCNKNNQFVQTSLFQKLPKYLIIHLSRFQQMENSIQKIKKILSYDETLNFIPSILQKGNKSVQYQLIGTIKHLGEIDFGHYIAQVRTQGNTWYVLNDKIVQRIFIKQQDNTSQSVYILFYEKIQQ